MRMIIIIIMFILLDLLAGWGEVPYNNDNGTKYFIKIFYLTFPLTLQHETPTVMDIRGWCSSAQTGPPKFDKIPTRHIVQMEQNWLCGTWNSIWVQNSYFSTNTFYISFSV